MCSHCPCHVKEAAWYSMILKLMVWMDAERSIVWLDWKDQARQRVNLKLAPRRSAPCGLGRCKLQAGHRLQKTNKIVILPSPTQARPGTDAQALVTVAFTYMRSGSLELLLASGEHPREPHDGGVYGVAGLQCSHWKYFSADHTTTTTLKAS